jgi:hypothetical protein
MERSARVPALRRESALRPEPALRSEPVLGRVTARSEPALRAEPVLLRVPALRPESALRSLTRRRTVPALRRGPVLRVAGRPVPGLRRRTVPALRAKASAGRIGAGRPEPVRAVPGLRTGTRRRDEAPLRRTWLRRRSRLTGESWWRAKAWRRREARLRGEAGLRGEAVLRRIAGRARTAVPPASLGRPGARLVPGRTLPAVAALLPLRGPGGVARGVEARRPAGAAGLLSLITAGLLSLIAGLAPLVARPGAGVTAWHCRALAVAILAVAGRLALTALASEVLPGLPLAMLVRLRRGSPAEPVGRVLWPAWAISLPLVPAVGRRIDRPPRDGGIVYLVAACPLRERCGGQRASPAARQRGRRSLPSWGIRRL